MLSRWKVRHLVVSLKNGLYELIYPGDHRIPALFIAGKLYAPSYVSLETALSLYHLLPETAAGVTSITTKPTRRMTNRHGLFLYRTVRPELFCGYRVQEEGGYPVLMAEPEKALADYLYFRNYRKKKMELGTERLDWKLVRRLDKEKIRKYFKQYGMKMEALHAVL
jgi:predicted transcriptional regulator of viral defense system